MQLAPGDVVAVGRAGDVIRQVGYRKLSNSLLVQLQPPPSPPSAPAILTVSTVPVDCAVLCKEQCQNQHTPA